MNFTFCGQDTNDKILQDLDEDISMVYIVVMVAYNTHNNPNELEGGGQPCVRRLHYSNS